MSESPWGRDAEVSVTLKHDGKYEAPWIVFRGSPEQVKADIIEALGWDKDAGDGKSLLELVHQADKQAKAEYGVKAHLGGRTISKERKSSTESVSEDTSAEAEAAEEGNPLLAQIAAVNTVDDLKKLWAENQEAFKDGELMTVWKARGKELSNA